MRFRELLENDEPTYFIRFGEVPEAERSGIGSSPNHIHATYRRSDVELGVSVYAAAWNGQTKRWDLDRDDISNIASLDELLYQGREGERAVYLVTGHWVRYEELTRKERRLFNDEGRWYPGIDKVTGTDGEPLIRNVKVVKQLRGDEVWAPGFDEE